MVERDSGLLGHVGIPAQLERARRVERSKFGEVLAGVNHLARSIEAAARTEHIAVNPLNLYSPDSKRHVGLGDSLSQAAQALHERGSGALLNIRDGAATYEDIIGVRGAEVVNKLEAVILVKGKAPIKEEVCENGCTKVVHETSVKDLYLEVITYPSGEKSADIFVAKSENESI